MLRLGKTSEARWLDLPHGVRVRVAPITTSLISAVRSEVVKRIAVMQSEEEAKAATGFDADVTGRSMRNPNYREGVAAEMMAEALVRYCVEEWEGVGDEDGNPLPINAASARAFAQIDQMAGALIREALAPLDARSAEGNGFAPTSAGYTEAGAITAPDAAKADAVDARQS